VVVTVTVGVGDVRVTVAVGAGPVTVTVVDRGNFK
jgi:hypothetical protein